VYNVTDLWFTFRHNHLAKGEIHMPEGIDVGDIVELKSGGPDMTVNSIGHTSMSGQGPLSAWCSWFDAKAEEKKGVFPLTSLKKKES
jgi:uncharacterized protein YodC (DUF2158 family)